MAKYIKCNDPVANEALQFGAPFLLPKITHLCTNYHVSACFCIIRVRTRNKSEII